MLHSSAGMVTDHHKLGTISCLTSEFLYCMLERVWHELCDTFLAGIATCVFCSGPVMVLVFLTR